MDSSVPSQIGIDSEVQWGLNYRRQKKKARKPSISPTSSPINIQLIWQKYQITRQLQELEQLKRKVTSPLPPRIPKVSIPSQQKPDRETLTKKEYLNFLATPRKHVEQSPPPNQIAILKKKLKIKEQCSPRLIQLARPKKVRIYETWRDYFNQLSLNCLERLNEMMHTDNTLDPKYARCCFKIMDRKRDKEKSKELKKHKKKLRKEKRECQKWLKMQIKTTADLVIKFLQNEPLLTLNFKQMLLSNVLMDELVKRRYIRFKPARNSKNPYRQSIVDIVDQLAVWMDTIVRYIDIQHLEADLAESPSLESLLGIQEEEGGEEEEEEEEEHKEKRYQLPPLPEMPELEDLGPYMEYAEAEADYSFATTTFDLLVGDVSETTTALMAKEEDTLKTLIKIFASSPSDVLDQLVDPEALPDVTYKDVLDRVKGLYDKEKIKQKQKNKTILEETLLAWAKQNDPDNVDEKLISEIQNIAAILAECMKREVIKEEIMAEAIAGEETDFTLATTVETTTPGYTSDEMDELFEPGEEAVEVQALEPLTEEEGEAQVLEALTEEEVVEAEEEGFKPVKIFKPIEEGEAGEVIPWGVKPAIQEPEEGLVEIEIEPKPPEMPEEELLGMRRDIPTMIPKHTPSRVFEHAPDTICCLTLKVWATWLLEVAYNAQAWSKWLNDIIHEIRRIASIIRGEIKDPQGNTVMFYKEDWIEFSEKVDKMIISWRQYSMHVKDLTDKIISNFRGKKIRCCPKCLEDNLIVNIPVAHDISQQLAEAMNTANYWRRWLDSIVMETKKLTSVAVDAADAEATSSYGTLEIVEVYEPHSSDSDESLYEIEELDPGNYKF